MPSKKPLSKDEKLMRLKKKEMLLDTVKRFHNLKNKKMIDYYNLIFIGKYILEDNWHYYQTQDFQDDLYKTLLEAESERWG